MSAYTNDSRVHKVSEDLFRVLVDGDRFTVFTDLDDRWLIQPPVVAKCTRVWSNDSFGSADDAIRELIGEPQ
jgi:hypothetical protein